MNERALRFLIAAVTLLVVPAALAQRKTVDIAFSFAPDHLYDHFDTSHMQLIQKIVREGVATKLSGPERSTTDLGAFPLFDFWARAGNNHLTIELDDDPTALGIEPPVILRLRMDFVMRPDDKPFIVIFRADGRNEPLGDASTFARDVVRAVAKAVDSQRQEWVDNLFREVVVAADVLCLPSEKAFVLPFTAAQYEFGEGSRFLVTLSSAEPFETRPGTSTTQMHLCVDRPPETVRRVQKGDRLRPNEVRLLRYVRFIAPTTATPPSAANLGSVVR
jgi:hypothetical protein